MKTTILTLVLAMFAGALVAQPAAGDEEKMKVFANWAGHWRGEAWMQMGPGEPKTSTVDEKVEPRLDGTVYLIEGVGKSVNPNTNQEMTVHHALALLSWDGAKNGYKFQTHLKNGRSTDAWFEHLGDNYFQWGFDVPNRGQTRYSIRIDPAKKTWNEIGEFSPDGNKWSKFFEMNLTKVE